MKRLLSMRGLVVLLVAVSLLAASQLLPLKELLAQALVWIDEIEYGTGLLLGVVYIPASILFIPAFIVSLAAGFMLGVFPGAVIISVGTTVGALASFLLARNVARDLLEAKLQGHKKFQVLDQAVAAQGFKVVLLSRIAPFLSYNILNYMYGVTRVSFRDYLLGTWLGMVPASIVLAFLGASAKSVPDIIAHPAGAITGHPFLIGGGVIVTLTIIMLLVRRAREALYSMTSDSREAKSVVVSTEAALP